MPIYEYRCDDCERIYNFLVRSVNAHKTPACPKCGGKRMNRVLSRFSMSRAPAGKPGADAGGGEGMPPMPDLGGLDENDPRALGRMMRKMAGEAGETLDPQMEEMVRRLESGEDPEKIEESMGPLPEGEGGSGGTPDNTLYEA